MRFDNSTLRSTSGRVAQTVVWEARLGEADVVADILRRLEVAVRSEPGTLAFRLHRSPDNDRLFYIYELYADEAAYAAHQQTAHFERLVIQDALPRLSRRERTKWVPLGVEAVGPLP